jgi:hypothetical protein
VIRTWPICTPVAAAGGTKAGTPAPPLSTEFSTPPTLPDPEAEAVTAPAGMSSPAPSVKAEAPFGTQAHTPTRVRPGCSTQAVRIVLTVLPALAPRLARSAKPTVAPPVSETVSDSVKLAFRLTARAFELTWAFTHGQIATDSIILAISKHLLKFLMDASGDAKSRSVFPLLQAALRVTNGDSYFGLRALSRLQQNAESEILTPPAERASRSRPRAPR